MAVSRQPARKRRQNLVTKISPVAWRRMELVAAIAG
jgi:hypothetical protein